MIRILAFTIFLAPFLLSCNSKTDTDDSNKTLIVCTTGIIGDAVINITDSLAEVKSLMGPGVDPHLYKATQGDLSLLQNADIIIYNGLHLEGKMVEILDKLRERKTCVAMEDFISKERLIEIEDYQGTYDPHIWFDIALWNNACQGLGNFLSDTISKEKSIQSQIERNTVTYSAKLIELDEEVNKRITSIPINNRFLVTAHDAFEYFGRKYDIEVRGLQGISTLSEAGIRDISELVDFLVERELPAVFIETSVSRRAIDAVVEGCKAKGHRVNIGGQLFSDALGGKESGAENYIDMVLKNVSTIQNGLKNE